jgi:hypothetical protein
MSTSLKYGLITAVITSGWLLLAYVLGLHTRHIAWGHYANFGAEIILALALQAHLVAGNYYWMPVWRGLIHGLATAMVAAMGVYCFLSVYLTFVNPEYPLLHLDWRVSTLRAAGESEEQIRAMARAYVWSTGPTGLPITVGTVYLLFGFIASPILTLWLNWRRKEMPKIG